MGGALSYAATPVAPNGAVGATRRAVPTLQELGVHRIDASAVRARGWENMPGAPLYVEHPEIGLVQLVARHTLGSGPNNAEYAVRRLNPLAGYDRSPYVGDMYRVPSRIARDLHFAIVNFQPSLVAASPASGGTLGQRAPGIVGIVSDRSVLYEVEWSKLQAIMTLDLNDERLARKVRMLDVEFLRTVEDLLAVQEAVRLLERDHEAVRSWTSVRLSERAVWGSILDDDAAADAESATVGAHRGGAMTTTTTTGASLRAAPTFGDVPQRGRALAETWR